MSPSHTVGLELKKDNTDPLEPDDYVTIPHGGLRTERYIRIETLEQLEVAIPHGGLGKRVLDDFVGRVFLPTSSPSHTVGSEQKRKLCFYFCMLRNSLHPTQWAWNSMQGCMST